MARTIIFLQNQQQVNKFMTVARIPRENVLAIALDPDIEPMLESRFFHFATPWNYLNLDDLRSTRENADRLAKSWFIPIGSDCLFNGQSVAETCWWTMEYFFREALSLQLLVRRVLDREKPSAVMFDGDEKRSTIIEEARESNTNGVLGAIIAHEAARCRIPIYPFCTSRFKLLLYTLGFKLAKSGMTGADIAVHSLLDLGAQYFTSRIPAMVASSIMIVEHILKWRHDYHNRSLRTINPPRDKKCVLFWGGDGKDFERSMELAELLEQQAPNYRAFVLGEGSHPKSAENKWCPRTIHIHRFRFLTAKEKIAWHQFHRRLKKRLKAYAATLDSTGNLGRTLCNPFLRRYFHFVLAWYHLTWWQNMAAFCIGHFKPQAVVIRWPVSIEAEAFRNAIDTTGISTKLIYTPHGAAGTIGSPYHHPEGFSKMDYNLSGGEIMTELLRMVEVTPDRIRQTGFQIYDRFVQAPKTPASPVVGEPNKQPVKILVVTCGIYDQIPSLCNLSEHVQTLSKIATFGQTNEDVEIAFKPHPRYDYDNIIKHICHKTGCVFHEGERDLAKLISGTDIVLAVNSATTASIEAMLLERPVILLLEAWSPHYRNSIPIVRWDGALILDTFADLPLMINKIKYSAEFRAILIRKQARFIRQYCHKLDGRAAHRIVEELLTISEEPADLTHTPDIADFKRRPWHRNAKQRAA